MLLEGEGTSATTNTAEVRAAQNNNGNRAIIQWQRRENGDRTCEGEDDDDDD